MTSPLHATREEQVARYVEDGRVPCPRFGDADLEECYVCGYLRAVHGDPAEWIACTYTSGAHLAGIPSLIASREEPVAR
jgi:hypothetical protein